jgi:type I restriction enzyme S subunit
VIAGDWLTGRAYIGTATPIKHITQLINGLAFKSEEWSASGPGIIRIANLNGSETFNHYEGDVDPRYRVADGDLLFSWSGNRGTSFGPHWWARPGDWYLNQHIFRVVEQNVDRRWLYWALRAATSYIEQQTNGMIGMVHVTKEELGLTRLPVPSAEEQRAIADYLDTETARIDALITKKRRMIELLAERRASAVVAILAPPNESDPGALWEERRIRHVCPEVTVGVVVNPSTYFADTGDPFIHGTDVHAGWIDTSALKRLSRSDNEALSKSRLNAGDVVAMRVGEPGRAAVVPFDLDGANCASILIFRRSEVLASEIVCEFLNSRLGRSQIEAVQYGAAQGVMNVGDATELRVRVPPADEQDEIVAALAELDRFAAQTRDRVHRQVELLIEHRQALITAAVTGEFEVPGVAA